VTVTSQTIEQEFQKRVCAQVRLVEEGIRRFRVSTPFLFDDGDHLPIVLKSEGAGWVLTDEGHTYMHLTYDLDEADLRRGTRQSIISNTLSAFGVADQDGELRLAIGDEDYGSALYSFVQALLRISDVSYITRERVRSTFVDDLREFLTEVVPSGEITFDWHDEQRDPNALHAVDARVYAPARPLLVFALTGDDRTRDATIALLHFEKWGVPFASLGVFEEMEGVNHKVVARSTDVFEKQFSNLSGNRDRIVAYIAEKRQAA
jgi:hypothetical protein